MINNVFTGRIKGTDLFSCGGEMGVHPHSAAQRGQENKSVPFSNFKSAVWFDFTCCAFEIE